MGDSTKRIPQPVVKRLTRYLTQLQALLERGDEWVSSDELADAMGLSSSTVRQDISHLDFSGISKRGYATQGLADVLMRVLGADSPVNVVIVGAGNLGRALALHGNFSRSDIHICAVFDADPKVVGSRIGSIKVRPMRDLPKVVQANNVGIGIIAVPGASAQTVADHLIAAGVAGLLNLASTHILAPRDVAVVDTRILASLRELCYAIKVAPRGKSRT